MNNKEKIELDLLQVIEETYRKKIEQTGNCPSKFIMNEITLKLMWISLMGRVTGERRTFEKFKSIGPKYRGIEIEICNKLPVNEVFAQ